MINTYGYAYQNPVMNIDPFGLYVPPSLPQSVVDTAAAFEDGISGGLTKMFRDARGIGSVNYCSSEYRGAHWAGIAAGLTVPVGRAAYVYKVTRLPSSGLAAAEVVALRNGLKAYFRGRHLARWMPRWNPRYGYPSLEQLLIKNGGNIAEVIARSGGTSLGWNIFLIGGGGAKAVNSTVNASGNECECES